MCHIEDGAGAVGELNLYIPATVLIDADDLRLAPNHRVVPSQAIVKFNLDLLAFVELGHCITSAL
jgi:hypothetical protein